MAVHTAHSTQTLSQKYVCRAHPGVAADSICLNCNDLLCCSCAANHAKTVTSHESHEIQKLTSLTAERLAAPSRTDATCSPGRSQEASKTFCPSQGGVTVCELCAGSKHRACPDVTEQEGRVMESRPPALRFQTNSVDILLSNNQQTAQWTGSFGDGNVVSTDPMAVNVLYQIVVDQIFGSPGSIRVGVAVEDPAKLTPSDMATPREPAVVIDEEAVYNDHVRKLQTYTTLGEGLANLHVGSRVGVLLDAARCLHLFIDGRDQGVAAHDITQPCYALFQLSCHAAQFGNWRGGLRQITALQASGTVS